MVYQIFGIILHRTHGTYRSARIPITCMFMADIRTIRGNLCESLRAIKQFPAYLRHEGIRIGYGGLVVYNETFVPLKNT